MAEPNSLCVHCHFYQPPRGNPFNEQPLIEPDAAPYKNWNERITAQSYRPNAEAGNFEHISFNVGETLAAWPATYTPDVYTTILKADAAYRAQYGAGNAIAPGTQHTILPLSRRPDQVTQ